MELTSVGSDLIFLSLLTLTVCVGLDAPRVQSRIAPAMLFWIGRMARGAHRGQVGDDPVVFAARDSVSLACGALVLAIGLFAGVQ